MRLDTKADGHALALRALRRLEREGAERCRVERPSQAGALRAALNRLQRKGTPEAVAGFSRIITDALGFRRYYTPGELAELYRAMGRDGRLERK